jgi:hypothetical protein
MIARGTAGAGVTTVSAPVTVPGVNLQKARAALAHSITRSVAVARRGAATVIGAAGLASGAIGAGAEWGWPVGLMVACPLAVWFASLLPSGTE